jgi:preprotein translocase subunit YajC
MLNMSSTIDAAMPLAQAASPSAPASGGGTWILLFYALMAAALYFLFIAPQRKKQKEHDALLKSLKTGDDIVTSAGIFGTITNVKEDRFVVRISDTTKIEIAKGFVQSVVKKADGDEKK